MRDHPESNVTHEEIEQRAYDIYLRRGAEPGRDVEDWLAAEAELAEEHSKAQDIPSKAAASRSTWAGS